MFNQNINEFLPKYKNISKQDFINLIQSSNIDKYLEFNNQVCDEIRDCGSPIEVTFSNFKAEDRDGNPVQLKKFSLTTHP